MSATPFPHVVQLYFNQISFIMFLTLSKTLFLTLLKTLFLGQTVLSFKDKIWSKCKAHSALTFYIYLRELPMLNIPPQLQ